MRRLAALLLCLVVAAACGDGGGAPDAMGYPPATSLAVGAAIADFAFAGIGEDGRAKTLRMHDDYDPHGSGVLVVRVQGGAWCGTCLWHAAHTRELLAGTAGARVRVLDLVVGDRDNAPATLADAMAWRARLDTTERVAVGIDPGFTLRALAPAGGVVLPMIALVDTRTMTIASVLSNPDPTELGRALAAVHGVAPPAKDEPLVDGLFHRNEWDMIHDVRTPGAPPPDPTDAVADDPVAAALGKALFFDTALSPAGVACASCHESRKDLSDDLAEARGIAPGDRKTPRIALAAFARFQFWDGHADSLWSQALGPLESATEMGSSRLFVARRIASAYARPYREAFPAHALPDVASAADDADPEAVTRVFVDAGKAIEAYERTFRVRPNALDAYAAGDFSALTVLQKQGLSVFAGGGCMQCHWGPRLTDDAFHVTRTPTGRVDGAADRGRIDGLRALATSEFSASGPWSDDPSAAPRIRLVGRDGLGAFKTPSLRGIAATTYFGHGGKDASLADVMLEYGSGGVAPSDPRAVGAREPWLPRLGETTRWSTATFLATLSGKPIAP